MKKTSKSRKQQSQITDPLKIVKEFQEKYRRTIPKTHNIEYRWEANPGSVGELKQKNYFVDFQ